MSLHREISFEDEICDYLSGHGWLYVDGDAAGRATRCLSAFGRLAPPPGGHDRAECRHDGATYDAIVKQL